MKRNILILFAVFSLIISLTGCGSSGHSNSVAPTPTTMTTLRVSLTQNGQPATGADVALYTSTAALREGLIQAQNNVTFRASIGLNTSEGIYKPTFSSDDGTYTFTVPTGEYTLIANKGSSRAVVTDIRAVTGISEGQEVTPITVADLKPTGKITGKVVANANYGITTAGVMVYLKDTSSVAITNSEGSFEISGVPEGEYSIGATTNQNNCYYSASLTSVTMNSSLSVAMSSNLELLEVKSSGTTTSVTGIVIDENNAKVANVLVLATNEENLLVSTTSQTGTFTLSLNNNDSYTVYVHGSKESSQNVEIDSDGNVKFSRNGTILSDLKFTMYSSNIDSYGCVKGNIKFSSDYASLVTEENIPDVGRYLVQLIGVDGTPYRTQTKADYKGNSSVSTFMFDNVYPGTYTVFVDPAGNGFVGSIGTFTVKAGQITDLTKISTATAEVKFVQPIFKAYFPDPAKGSDAIEVIATYPFNLSSEIHDESIENAKFYCRNLANNQIKELIVSPEGNSKILLYAEDWKRAYSNNGKYEIIIQKSWKDDNTGLSGILSETQVINYTSSTSYLGNIIVENVNEPAKKFENITYNEGTFYGLTSGDNYLKINKTSEFQKYETDYFGSIEEFSGLSGVLQDPDHGFLYIDDITNESAIASQVVLPVSFDTSDMHNIDIISYNCISVCVGDSVYILNYSDGSYNLSSINYTGLTNLNSAYLAKSSNNKCYFTALLSDSSSCTAKIYEVGYSTECASYTFFESTGLRDFKVMNDGSFYLEFGEGGKGVLPKGSVRITTNGGKEISYLSNRVSCFMDKQGFLYRFDTITKSVIKTASLDGKPLDTYNPSSDTAGVTVEDLNGILGLEEDSSGSSTLFVW